MGTSIMKQVLREYEKDRTRARHKLAERREQQVEKVPRLREIDHELNMTGLALTKAVLMKKDNVETILQELRSKNESLQREQEEIMTQHGFPLVNDDLFQCKECKDTGFVGQAKCTCLKQKLISKYYEMSNLSKVLENENFDTFDISYYANEVDPKTGISPKSNINRIWKVCLSFVKNFDNEFHNLLFYGATGLGKTFLSNCIAKDLLDMGKTVLYVTAPQLFKMIEEFRFNRSDEDEQDEYMDMIFSTDLLIIDDLGTEFSTSVTTSELFNFVNTRLLNRKHTIISTNLNPTDLQNLYSERIVSRIVGNYILLPFVGEDIRMQKKFNGK